MAVTNLPRLAGSLASPKTIFGYGSRYAVYAVHTRFDAVEWFVDDAESVDPVTDGLAIIRQEATKEAAMEGLA